MSRAFKKKYLDTLKILVRGGTGGHGLPQFGGIGGKGGDVYVQGSGSLNSLAPLAKKSTDFFQAGKGWPSRRTRLVGEPGNDLFIKVPVGVSIEDSDKQHIGDINKHNEKIIVALGGRGGDKFNDNHGTNGQQRVIKLDLKMISDAVFVGFPNAGKSSLLKAISKASPKIANYPFTTISPNLGNIVYADYRKITMADLPGLIEGAHKNLGLGHGFLKHIVRTRLLIFLIDINGVDLGALYERRTPLETLCILNKEIQLYDDTLLNKPAILAVSKMDSLEDSEERFRKFVTDYETLRSTDTSLKLVQFDEIVPISSHSGMNLDRLKLLVRDVIDKHAEVERTIACIQ